MLVVASILVSSSIMAGEHTQEEDDPKARRIMRLVDQRNDGDNRTSRMEMILEDRHGGRRIRELKTFMRDFGPDKEHTYKLMHFLSPADVRDTGFLTYDYDGERDDDQWLYLPALRKTKRIASDDKTSAFMGSDFSYADMTKPELENYTFRLLGEKEVDGHPTWIIQRTPVSRGVVEKYGYTKSVLFVRQDCHVTVRSVHWEDKPNRFKYYQVTRLERVDDIWTVLEAQMISRQGKRYLHGTVLSYDDVCYGRSLEDAFFTVRTLERGL
jgi:hypothetical protein